ncbi:MAG: hypothetical protein JOY79_06390 [Acidobacteriaceae bacterium]|nr:hypothetical protein [Acidobacteriaceae bacterium]
MNIRLCSLICVLSIALSATSIPLTTVSDTVYRADGTPASGTVVISWPAFITSDNRAVAAGSKTVAIAPDGSLTVDLAPNFGGTPAGTYYKVIYKLSDAIACRQIVDENKFKEGLTKVIDGTVECLNASVWYKGQQPAQ